jgi:nitrate reductase delta subunit
MIELQTQILLAIASRLLTYPSDDYLQEWADIDEAIDTELTELDAAVAGKLREALAPLRNLTLQEYRELYVASFDLKQGAGLYLTAHELGDSRKRGVELIELQNLIQNAGYLYRADEISDYIPLLYEFLAVADGLEPSAAENLHYRLGLVTARIQQFLYDDNVFKLLFTFLMENVFETPTPEELERLEKQREKPDMDPMPYPLMYK